MVQSPLFRWKYILHLIWKSRFQSLEKDWRDTESMLLEVQCEVSSQWCHLLVLVHCVFWSPQSTQPSTRKFLEHFMLPSADKLYKDADFIFQQDFGSTLPKVPKAGSMTMVSLCLIDQQTHQTWTPQRIYGVLSRGRWETPDPIMQMSWRPLSKQPGLHYTWAVPQADCLHATPHWCSNSCKRRPNQVLSA